MSQKSCLNIYKVEEYLIPPDKKKDCKWYKYQNVYLISIGIIKTKYSSNHNLLKMNNFVEKYTHSITLGVFWKMNLIEKQKLLKQLKADYRQILINYFTTDSSIVDKIDQFINALFYANIPVPQIIEMHMEIIDDFSKQLRLEGRDDEALLDYRLALIDVLAHLCETYRCSLPKHNNQSWIDFIDYTYLN